tara:strand:+ start:102 stop:1283 length:1182 start_codon:yes stop_codon:yes gene_type:complete
MFLNKGINVLSLFDGMSCGRIALARSGIAVNTYHSSEIDKHAITVSKDNWDNNHHGDITKWREWVIDWASIHLILAGSPCQGFSFAGLQLAFDDPRSALFFVFIDILNHINSERMKANKAPVKFMLENVKMKKEHLTVISEQVGVEPVFINSALVSAQNRKRFYWCNWEVDQPEDLKIMLADIIEYGTCDATVMTDRFSARQKGRKCLVDEPKDKAVNLSANEYVKNGRQGDYISCNSSGEQKIFNLADNKRVAGVSENDRGYRPYRDDDRKTGLSEVGRILKRGAEKTDTLTTSHAPKIIMKPRGNNPGGERALDGKTPCLSANSWEHNNHLSDGIHYRKLTTIECERLQTVDDNYTKSVSNTQRYKMLGNGWTVDVIKHILDSSGLHHANT